MAALLLVGFAPDVEVSLTRALSAHKHTIQARPLGSGALKFVREATPALILAYVELSRTAEAGPPDDCFELCSAVRALPSGERYLIIFIDQQDTLANKLSGFTVGGDDYLAFPFQMAELALRVEALLRRSVIDSAPPAISDLWLRVGPFAFNSTTGEVLIADRHEQLTPVETRLLSYLINHPGQPCSSEELLRHVWHQYPGTGDPALVRVHMRHLRAKLEADMAAPRLLKTSNRLGYYLAQGESDESIS